jgi:hypothetical protein
MGVATMDLDCHFLVYCEAHTPAVGLQHGRAHSRRVEQGTLRVRARVNTSSNSLRTKQLQQRRFSMDQRAARLQEDRYEPGRCCVCFSTNAEVLAKQRLRQQQPQPNGEPAPEETAPVMLRCEICGIDVHHLCYGVTDAALTELKEQSTNSGMLGDLLSTWQCTRCQTVKDKLIQCVLCPRKGGAMKTVRSSPGEWAHVACANWLPETDFYQGEIYGVEDVPHFRRNLRCYLCKRCGPCIQCSADCYEAFHPLCGLFSNAYLNIYEDHGQVADYAQYCREHSPLLLLKGVDTPPSYYTMFKTYRSLAEGQQLLTRVRRRAKVQQRALETKLEQDSREDEELVADLVHRLQSTQRACRKREADELQAAQKAEQQQRNKRKYRTEVQNLHAVLKNNTDVRRTKIRRR